MTTSGPKPRKTVSGFSVHRAGPAVVVTHDVLGRWSGGPEELAGLALKVRTTQVLPGTLAGPAHRVGVRRDRAVEQHPIEAMVAPVVAIPTGTP